MYESLIPRPAFFVANGKKPRHKKDQTRKPSDNPYFAKFVVNIYSG